MRWPALLLGAGAVVYTIGGLLIFALGPQSSLIQIFEVGRRGVRARIRPAGPGLGERRGR